MDLNEESTPVERLTRDLKNAARTLSDDEARFLVDAYYIMQDDRKRSNNQVRALDASSEPNEVLVWFAKQNGILESQIRRALDAYTESHEMGSWMRTVVGIGPIISAGLLAHIDMSPWRCNLTRQFVPSFDGHAAPSPLYDPKAVSCTEKEPHGPLCHRERLETVGQLWRFAGLDPSSKWEKGQRRPWNASLKVVCWKAGQSFMKFSGRDDCLYGKLYVARKGYEIARNEAQGNAQIATAILASRNIGKSTEAYKALIVGRLPPGQIDARARRYAVKQFLSDLHREWYHRHFGGLPPLPYPIQILGHAHLRLATGKRVVVERNSHAKDIQR